MGHVEVGIVTDQSFREGGGETEEDPVVTSEGFFVTVLQIHLVEDVTSWNDICRDSRRE